MIDKPTFNNERNLLHAACSRVAFLDVLIEDRKGLLPFKMFP